ncbi:Hsp70 family protein [Phytomonospora endophytica]|uniref:Hsp70 protein n=1 Tax=Phytomonospora endophytica TaxID=714109 RepID=A0A841FP70_9ACTN|nr:Hsp70 family protein [Phytomonospora endophytica]MBB6034379.1 hypothetical protein [Phytomonospora endophytica]GIG66772.1 molecular chaperone Hsp70 [Phytomonospora endophytica]
MDAYRLGIDYGTSNTVAVLRWPDGRTRPLLFDSSPLLSSAVHAAPDGRLTVGRDAERDSRTDPARFEPNPKRCVTDGSVLLGDRSFPVVDLIAATLREVAREAERVAGTLPDDVVITYPASWGALRRTTLTEAAIAAGLPRPRLLPEPVAAAAYFATGAGHRVADGQVVVVYDLGGGTLDVSAVRRTPDGYEVVAVEGMPEFGGVDLDAVLVRLLGGGVEPAEWARLLSPTTDEERRRTRTLWDDARAAKEALSRRPNSSVLLPTTGRDLQVGREAFWEAAREYLVATGELTRKVVARVGGERLAGLFLVGGSTRMPLVATILHQATGIAPTVLEQPELVVAEGALQATLPRTEADDGGVIAASVPSDDLIVLHAPPLPTDAAEPVFTPAAKAPEAPSPPPKPRTGRFVAGLVALMLVAAGVSWALENATGDDDPGGTGSSSDDPGDDGGGEPDGSGALYAHKADLCDTDLKPVRGIAGEVVGDPTASGPTQNGDATGTGCTFTLMKSTAEAFQLLIEADVYSGGGTHSSTVSIAGGEQGELKVDVDGAKAQWAYLKTPAGGYANHVYNMVAVSANLVLSIDLIGVSSDDLERTTIDKAVASLAEQVMGALASA